MVSKFWYVPDLKNNRLRDIYETRISHEHDPIKILFNASRVYTFTDPKVDIGIGCKPYPLDLKALENHFKAQPKATEVIHHMERIPLIERTTAATEVMTLNLFSKLCKMYGEASCKLD